MKEGTRAVFPNKTSISVYYAEIEHTPIDFVSGYHTRFVGVRKCASCGKFFAVIASSECPDLGGDIYEYELSSEKGKAVICLMNKHGVHVKGVN